MDFESLDSHLNILCDVERNKKFGDIQVVLAGDFGQLLLQNVNHFTT